MDYFNGYISAFDYGIVWLDTIFGEFIYVFREYIHIFKKYVAYEKSYWNNYIGDYQSFLTQFGNHMS